MGLQITMNYWLVVLPVLFLGLDAANGSDRLCLDQSLLTFNTVQIMGTFPENGIGNCGIRSKPNATLFNIAFGNGTYKIQSGIGDQQRSKTFEYVSPGKNFELGVRVLDGHMMQIMVVVDGLQQYSFLEISDDPEIGIGRSRVIDCSQMASWDVINRDVSSPSGPAGFPCSGEVPLSTTPTEGWGYYDVVCVSPLVAGQSISMESYFTDEDWSLLTSGNVDRFNAVFQYVSNSEWTRGIETVLTAELSSNTAVLDSWPEQFSANYSSVWPSSNLIKWKYTYLGGTQGQITLETDNTQLEPWIFEDPYFPVGKPLIFACYAGNCAITSEGMHSYEMDACMPPPPKCGKGNNRKRRNAASSSDRRDQLKALLGGRLKFPKKLGRLFDAK